MIDLYLTFKAIDLAVALVIGGLWLIASAIVWCFGGDDK